MEALKEYHYVRNLFVYLCPQCQHPFTRRSNLLVHLRDVEHVDPNQLGWLVLNAKPIKGYETSVWRYPAPPSKLEQEAIPG